MKFQFPFAPFLKVTVPKTDATFLQTLPSPPGPKGFLLIGNLPLLSRYPHQYQALNDLASQYGDIFQIQIGVRPVVVVSGLETIKQALLKQTTEFAGRPPLYTLQTVIQGRTMGGRDYGTLYKKHKEIVGSAMHAVFVNPDITPVESQIIEEATQLADIFASYEGKPFDPKFDLGLAAAGVMFRILFSDKNCRMNPDCQQLVQYATDFAANTVGSLIVDFIPQARFLCGAGLKKFNRATETMDRLIMRKIRENRESYSPNVIRNMADALLKAANEVDSEDRDTLGLNESLLLEGTCQEMMGTGLQPMYPLMRWLLLYMVAYPHIQGKIQQELDDVIGQNQTISYEDRHKLPYTEACIHEILRHAPLFPITIPHSTTTDTQLNGYFIAKDSLIMVNLHSLTRDTRYWTEPDTFNPDRFLNEQGQIRDDLLDKYYPFGLGKRRCFGEYLGRLETFLFFSNLLHRCRLEAVPNQTLNFAGVSGTMLHPHDYSFIAKPRF